MYELTQAAHTKNINKHGLTTVDFSGNCKETGTSCVYAKTDYVDDPHVEHDFIAALLEEARFPHNKQRWHVQYFESKEHDDHRDPDVKVLSFVQGD